MAVTRLKFSGSTDGKNIKVVQTATAGTLIHTADGSAYDEVYLFAHNSAATAVLLTIEFGGVSDPDDLIVQTIPSKDGAELVIPGWALSNSLVVRAFAASANVITINGYVLRVA
jgi:hypothetical protein